MIDTLVLLSRRRRWRKGRLMMIRVEKGIKSGTVFRRGINVLGVVRRKRRRGIMRQQRLN